MNSIKERFTTNNEESSSRFKNYIKVPITDKNNKLLNEEKTLPDGTIVRFVNGLIDGNIYDKQGNIVTQRPAIEYSSSQEFWTKGVPDGFPAVSQNMGYYEEDWKDGHIVAIREESKLEDISFLIDEE